MSYRIVYGTEQKIPRRKDHRSLRIRMFTVLFLLLFMRMICGSVGICNLIIRLGGYSDYFVNLGDEYQDNVIERTFVDVYIQKQLLTKERTGITPYPFFIIFKLY